MARRLPFVLVSRPSDSIEEAIGRANRLRGLPIGNRDAQLSKMTEAIAGKGREVANVEDYAESRNRRARAAANVASQIGAPAEMTARPLDRTTGDAIRHADECRTIVNSLDTYCEKGEGQGAFIAGHPVLSFEARARLDDLAVEAKGQLDYIFEMKAHSPALGGAGIQSSERLAEAVKRYLVIQHRIPSHCFQTVALESFHAEGEASNHPVTMSSVHIRLLKKKP